MKNYIELLNDKDISVRLDALSNLKSELLEDKSIIRTDDVNNHIHTIYSFSPYSPTKAVYMAYKSGLKTAGIMDHDSISGAEEFIEAGKILGLATTIGIECRVKMGSTPLNGKRINNPDQNSVAYMALHGVPHTQIQTVKEFFAPYAKARNVRNEKMVAKINDLMEPYGISYSFEKDVMPLSEVKAGGSITERHILFALSLKIIEKYSKGASLVSFIEDTMKLSISDKIKSVLLDEQNPYYEYDLLGVLKSDLVERFYIEATDECPNVEDVIALSNKIGAISAYAYLGDVGSSVTGDKKTQKFEDDYIDLLFETINKLGFNAVTYMPSRNTLEQLLTIKKLCDKYGFFQISGEDINTPRQVFICEALKNPEFKNLIDATWALIGHEKAATVNIADGMFSKTTKEKFPSLDARIEHFKTIGTKI